MSLCRVVELGTIREGALPSPLRGEMTVSERVVTGVGKDWTWGCDVCALRRRLRRRL